MKLIFTIAFTLFYLNFTNGQNHIDDIKVYNMWSSYDSDNNKWSEWKVNDEVFILNYKDSENIARCRLKNTIQILKKDNTTPIKKGIAPNGYEYTEIKVTGKLYVPYTLRFYDNNPEFGLELVTGSVLIRFAKK